MRLWSIEVVVRDKGAEHPHVDVRIDVEDEVPHEAVQQGTPGLLRRIADDMESQAVETVITERG